MAYPFLLSDEDIKRIKRITPDLAARYLGGTASPQLIRLWCRDRSCPFGVAIKNSPNRYTYIINKAALIKYKNGGEEAS